MNDPLILIAAGIAVAAVVYALTLRKAVTTRQAIVDNASREVARLNEQMKSLEKSQKDLKTLVSQRDSVLKGAEAKSEELKKRLATKDNETQKKIDDKHKALQNLERRIEILEEEKTVITSQLAEAVREKKQMADEAKQKTADNTKVDRAAYQQLANQLKDMRSASSALQKENKYFKSEVNKAREILKKVNPGELKKTKAKLNQIEQLYRSAKGLREMADERNENWQVALRAMALHITGQEDQAELPTGPLVGRALEKIGKDLVDDEHSLPAQPGELQGSTPEAAASSSVTSETTETV